MKHRIGACVTFFKPGGYVNIEAVWCSVIPCRRCCGCLKYGKKDMTQDLSLARLRWACRRGMLELDVLLLPFVERVPELTETQRATFERLLDCDDPELFAWFMGHQACDDPELAAMVALIKESKPLQS